MIRLLCAWVLAMLLAGCTTVEEPPSYGYMGYNNYYPVSSYGVTEYAYPTSYSDNYYVRNSGVIPY